MVEDIVFTFMFPVNKSFMSQNDHPITFRSWSHDDLVRVIGPIRHSSRPVRVVNVGGVVMDGKVRHSQTRGKDYYQLNCSDDEIVDGLTKGDTIQVQLVDTGERPELRLHST